MPTGFTQVSASALKDSTGTVVANATISFYPVNNLGVPISFRAGGGGQVMSVPVTAQVTNGAFTILLADSTLTLPANVGYSVSVIDNVSGKSLLGAGYSCVQPSGAAWNFDTYQPNLAPLVIAQYGPSAYDLAGGNAVWGSLSAWLASLKGDTGTVNYGTTTPIGDTTSGSVGVAVGVARIDHTHPLPTNLSTVTGDFSIVGNLSSAQLKVLTLPNPLNLSFAITDAVGNVALGVDANGVVIGTPMLPSSTKVVGDTVTLAGEIYSNTLALLPSNPLNLLFAVTDRLGNVAFGVDASGNVIGVSSSGGGTSGTGSALTVAQDNDGTIFYSSVVNGLFQIFRKERGGTALQLTSAGNNASAMLSRDGTAIMFYTDRTGVWLPYQMDTVGNNQLPAGSTVLTSTDVLILGSNGQSTSVGAFGAPALSTTQPFTNTMLVPTTNPSIAGPVIHGDLGYTGLTPLIETATLGGASALETHASGLANSLSNLGLLNEAAIYPSVSILAGISGTPLSGLNNTELATATAAAITYLSGKRCVMPGCAFLHGEADEQSLNATYGAQLLAFRDGCEIAIQAATGQSINVPFFLMQLSSWYSNVTSTIAPQQLALAKNNPNKFVLCGPRYQYAYVSSLPHFTNVAYRQQGELIAKVMWHVLHGRRWRPLSFRSATRVDNSIYVRFWVPVAPLVIDTSLVTAPTVTGGMNGFEFRDGLGTTITGVAIYSPDTVRVTLSAASAAAIGTASLDYARTAGASAPTGAQARGNLRDSDAAPSFYGYNSFNWMIHDTIAC